MSAIESLKKMVEFPQYSTNGDNTELWRNGRLIAKKTRGKDVNGKDIGEFRWWSYFNSYYGKINWKHSSSLEIELIESILETLHSRNA